MKNFGMERAEQYMAAQRRPRDGTRISTNPTHYTVMLSVCETSLAIALLQNQK
jgi:hypothetical protein